MPIAVGAGHLPEGFVHLRDFAPSIRQDMRYFGNHNFIGRPIDGYLAPECILTRPAAEALAAVQEDVAADGLRVKVFDCFRPRQAVSHFVRWSQDTADQPMKTEFYPNVDKSDFFRLGYVAERSGHSRGSTVDLILEPADAGPMSTEAGGDRPLVACTAPLAERFPDSPLDFGTGFDCMDPRSHPDNTEVPPAAQANRARLTRVMERHGFRGLPEEWWHFTLVAEPFPDTYFDFPVNAPTE
jgi:D-alanyl-D-alanine dipeptidase